MGHFENNYSFNCCARKHLNCVYTLCIYIYIYLYSYIYLCPLIHLFPILEFLSFLISCDYFTGFISFGGPWSVQVMHESQRCQQVEWSSCRSTQRQLYLLGEGIVCPGSWSKIPAGCYCYQNCKLNFCRLNLHPRSTDFNKKEKA